MYYSGLLQYVCAPPPHPPPPPDSSDYSEHQLLMTDDGHGTKNDDDGLASTLMTEATLMEEHSNSEETPSTDTFIQRSPDARRARKRAMANRSMCRTKAKSQEMLNANQGLAERGVEAEAAAVAKKQAAKEGEAVMQKADVESAALKAVEAAAAKTWAEEQEPRGVPQMPPRPSHSAAPTSQAVTFATPACSGDGSMSDHRIGGIGDESQNPTEVPSQEPYQPAPFNPSKACHLQDTESLRQQACYLKVPAAETMTREKLVVALDIHSMLARKDYHALVKDCSFWEVGWQQGDTREMLMQRLMLKFFSVTAEGPTSTSARHTPSEDPERDAR